MRIRLKSDAVCMILERVQRGDYNLIVSPARVAEITANSDQSERSQILGFWDVFGTKPIWILATARARAEQLHRSRVGLADSAHLAFAEQAAQAFITCDDELIRKSLKVGIRISCMGPVEFALKEGLS